ncbi:MAG TPA: energy transducer TonB [Pyrinomonadaceae bacterium]|nr:energy transducer TonB [Pyrinomonadaceae bacterium]
MKTKLLLITCILILFASAVNAQKPDAAVRVSWQQYKVGGEGFSVAFPILPAMHLTQKWLEGDKKPRREVLLGSYADSVVYTVYVLENSNSRVSLEDFIGAQTSSGLAWKVNSGRDVSREGLSGKSFLSTVPQDGMVQFFASEDRLYEFRAFGASPEDPRMTKFFSSVSFGKAKNAVEVKEGSGLPYDSGVQEERPEKQLRHGAFAGKDVNQKVRLAMKPEPSYTEDARQNLIAGTVVLKCIFRYDGSVTDIRTVSGLPYGLTQKAIEAARRIRFIPAIKDGKHVSMWMQLEYNFNLY